jgi:Raf kinase inhibitor-like YbhB/YbcL family protein
MNTCRRSLAIWLIGLAASGCGSDDGDDGDASTGGTGGTGGTTDSGAGGSTGPLVFTDALTAGTTIPPRYKCPQSIIGSGTGDNRSPSLEWTGVPSEARSLAVLLLDTRYGVFHWGIWDIAPEVTALPEGIDPGYDVTDPAGAHQVGLGGNAYFGPCSDAGPAAGTYAFRLHALDVEPLPVDATTAPADVQAAVEAATIDMVEWVGTPE